MPPYDTQGSNFEGLAMQDLIQLAHSPSLEEGPPASAPASVSASPALYFQKCSNGAARGKAVRCDPDSLKAMHSARTVDHGRPRGPKHPQGLRWWSAHFAWDGRCLRKPVMGCALPSQTDSCDAMPSPAQNFRVCTSAYASDLTVQ